MARPETSIALPVVEWMRSEGWDVYQEVTGSSGVADIVGASPRLLHAVEVKGSLTFDVIAQARNWIDYANLVSIAVPSVKTPRSAGRRLAERIVEEQGMGLIEVGPVGGVTVRRSPPLHRHVLQGFRQALREEQKTYAPAGTSTGKRWTPFRDTVTQLARVVSQQPGISLRSAIDQMRHHYASSASARAHLSDLIERGVISDVQLRREGKSVLLFPMQSTNVADT